MPLRLELLATRKPTWRLLEGLEYRRGGPSTPIKVKVPKGWITDLTSIPWWLPMQKDGPWTPASVVHDLLYAKGRAWMNFAGTWYNMNVSRKWADELYYEAMLELGVEHKRAKVIYYGVRLGGWRIWRKYRRRQN